MSFIKRRWWILVLVAILVGGGVTGAIAFSGSSAAVPPGHIDDGAELLPQASITLDQAIAAAQKSESGAVGEVDLEMYQGQLVFNVDIGDKDVKVDASNGNVLGSIQDDNNKDESSDNNDESSNNESAALSSKAVISAADAEAAALAANPGTTAVKVELDNENGVVVYSVELSNGLDVKVDAATGKIIHTEAAETDTQDGPQEQQDTED